MDWSRYRSTVNYQNHYMESFVSLIVLRWPEWYLDLVWTISGNQIWHFQNFSRGGGEVGGLRATRPRGGTGHSAPEQKPLLPLPL